ncbi:unnamed protein product [Calypogeia fissa]
MASKKYYCKYCLEGNNVKTILASWANDHAGYDILGCSCCIQRHEKQVTALKAQVMDLQNALGQSKETHEAQLSSMKTQNSFDLSIKQAEYYKVLAQVKNLEKEVTILKVQGPDIQAALAENKDMHETALSSMKAESSLALRNKQAEYEQLQAQVKKLEAENNIQRRKLEFLKLNCGSLRETVVSAGGDLHASMLVAKSPVLQTVLKSPVFQKLLETESAEKLVKEFTSDDIPTPVLEAMMDFCHSGELIFSELVPPGDVLRAAHALEIGFLKEFCETELCQRLNVDNVAQMLKLSQKFRATKLQGESEKVFKENFDVLRTTMYDTVLEGTHFHFRSRF